MAVEVKNVPDMTAVKMKAPDRVEQGTSLTRIFKSTWELLDWSKDENNPRRAQTVHCRWVFNKKANSKMKSNPAVTHEWGTGFVESEINMDNLTIGKTTFTRQSFYPNTSYKLFWLSISVWLKNVKGWGKPMTLARKFQTPLEPSISAFEFDEATGKVTATISTFAGSSVRERYDTRYTLVVNNKRTGKKKKVRDTSTLNTELRVSYDVSDYQRLSYGEYVSITLTAWSRGYAGDSKKVSRTVYVSYPAKANIKSVDVATNKKGNIDITGKCTAFINTNASKSHPVDVIELEYLVNVPYKKASEIAGDANWQASGIKDNGGCTALALSVDKLIPEKGYYSWIRAKTYHLSEAVLYRYSNYVRLTALETPAETATDERIKIVSAITGADGTSIDVQLAWNKDGLDDATGTELSWDTDAYAWKSTKDPTIYNFEWSDGEYEYEGDTYHDSAFITIKDITEGETYYVRARRYAEGDVTTFSPYSNTESCIPNEQPDSIVASCDSYVSEGSALPVRWTYSGRGIQKKWQIVASNNDTYALTSDTELTTYYTRTGTGEVGDPYVYTAVADPVKEDASEYYIEVDEDEYIELGEDKFKVYYTRSGSGTKADPYVYTEVAHPVAEDLDIYYEGHELEGTVIASGEGSLGATQIPYERLEYFAVKDKVTFTVQASTGGDYVASEEHSVKIVPAPDLTLSVPSTMTSQSGFSFDVSATTLCDLLVTVTADGMSGQFPQGVLTQLYGDTIYSDEIVPEWEEELTPYTATLTLPTDLDFWDSGLYTISVTAVDRESGLKSEPQSEDFTVAWEQQAVPPHDYITLTPIDSVDLAGVHHKAVQIDLLPPEGSEETDVYDIYRMSGGRAQLIADGLPLTTSVTDEYAPYGDERLYYRIAIRTEDGDIEFCDVEYTAEGKMLRFDWAEGYLELPYGVQVADSYSKSVDIRHHMDGSIDGYWNENVERKGSLSTSVIKLVQPTEIEMARKLATYTGAVFVRTPDGSAYPADVQVSDLTVENTAVTTVAFDAVEIGLTSEFRIQ